MTVTAEALDSEVARPTVSSERRRVALGVLLALGSGGLANLAFPPFELWPLILVAFVPMVVAQHRVMPARWSGLAVGLGVGAYFAGQLTPGLSFAGAGVAIVFQLLPLYLAIFVTALAWRSRAFQERTGYRWFLVSAPLAWVGIDALRSLANEAFAGTFANPVYALYDHPALLQPVSVFGIWGLELLVLVGNWTVAMVVIAALDRRAPARVGPTFDLRSTRRSVAVVVAAAGAWVLASVAMLKSPTPTVRVAAVQTGLKARTRAERAARFQRDIEQTRAAARRGARLVVWNEGGLRFDPKRQHTAELRALTASTNAYLVIGYRVHNTRGWRNEVTVLAPDGKFLGTYGKEHPGTFAGDYNVTKGLTPVYRTDFGPITTIICYDLDFTDTARRMAEGGARLIATPSADVPSIGKVHFTHMVFRAIENRVSMVKADNEFDSVIIDPYGRVIRKVDTSKGGLQATLVGSVPLGEGTSPWVSLGDWLGWLCLAGTAGLLSLAAVTRRRVKDGGRPPG